MKTIQDVKEYEGGKMNTMMVNTAKKILNKNGIAWSNLFDLCFVENNANFEGKENILTAINRIKRFILSGK